jgi:D-glycero-D-manno-heptose 1,7-bisphosphate phosphatase
LSDVARKTYNLGLNKDTGSDFLEVWCQTFAPRLEVPRAGLFLDRDGVILKWVRYLHRGEDVALIPGSAETIARANRRGVPVVLITNQAGIGRGQYGWDAFEEVQQALMEGLRARGAHLDGVFACPHHSEGVGIYAHPDHPARKPRPGMLLEASKRLGIDLGQSWIVGDNTSDLEAGRAASLAGGVLVLTGLGAEHLDSATALRTPSFEVLVAESLPGVEERIPLLA